MKRWLAVGLVVLQACGDDDYAPDVAGPGEDAAAPPDRFDASVPVGVGGEDAAVDAGVAPVTENEEPVGLDALTPEAFASLWRLRLHTHVHHTSSADRSGANADYGTSLRQDAHGDSVLWDRRGPGSLRRIWFTGFSPEQHVKLYFDGEVVPRVDASIGQFFGGGPFLPPLALDAEASSGGFVSLVPFSYAQSLVVTVSGGVRYFNVDGHDLAAAASFTGAEDSLPARALLARAGTDPKPVPSGRAAATQTLDVDGEAVLLDVDGPRQIASIELSLPGVYPLPAAPPTDVTENGRVGASTFTLAIDPDNFGVMLGRRLDYSVPDQSVQVAIDGANAGEWRTPGSDAHFRDAGFWLPETLTRGKSSLSVALSGGTAYRAWAVSHTLQGRIQTDTLDVGDVAAEAAHSYAGPAATVTTTARLPTLAELAPALNALHLVVTWDHATAPAIDAPLGSLVGVGAFGPGAAAGLGAGLRADGTLYLYFPMPFAEHARVALRGHLTGVTATVRHDPFEGSFADAGQLASSYAEVTSTPGVDLPFLDTTGAGQIVAVSQSVQDTSARSFMQGDERLYVDGARTPVVQGTGTEDFYNGGFYFQRGPFGVATHGESVLDVSSGSKTAMYRQFPSDPLVFRAGARLSIEHGAGNAAAVQAAMLCLYYRQATPRLAETDVIHIGDAASESAHGYVAQGETWAGSSAFSFEGTEAAVAVTASGRAHRGSAFDLTVRDGVVLRRLFDQSTPQEAAVWIDGVLAGTWYTAETNPTHRFREEDFVVPDALTLGKTRVHVELRVPAAAAPWNEYELRALGRN